MRVFFSRSPHRPRGQQPVASVRISGPASAGGEKEARPGAEGDAARSGAAAAAGDRRGDGGGRYRTDTLTLAADAKKSGDAGSKNQARLLECVRI